MPVADDAIDTVLAVLIRLSVIPFNRYRLSPTLYSYPLFHFLHKKHVHLVPQLSEAIAAIKSSEQ